MKVISDPEGMQGRRFKTLSQEVCSLREKSKTLPEVSALWEQRRVCFKPLILLRHWPALVEVCVPHAVFALQPQGDRLHAWPMRLARLVEAATSWLVRLTKRPKFGLRRLANFRTAP